MRLPRGFSLPEVLVGMSLLALVLTLTAQVLSPSLRIWNLDQARSTVEATGMLLERRLAAELLTTARTSITTLASPPAVSFLVPRGYDPETGSTLWSGFVVYALDRENRLLYRKVWPNPKAALQVPPLSYSFPATSSFRLTSDQLRRIATTNNGTEVRVARYVSDLQVLPGTPGYPGGLVLRLELPTQAGVETRVRRLDLSFRNG